MNKILIIPVVLLSLTGCEVTNSTFGTPEKQALVSSGQIGVNYFQSKLNEEIFKNQQLEQQNRELKEAVSRARSMRPPVIAKSVETARPVVVVKQTPKKIVASKPLSVKKIEEKSKIDIKKEPKEDLIPVPSE